MGALKSVLTIGDKCEDVSMCRSNNCPNGVVRSRDMGYEKCLEEKCLRSLMRMPQMDRVMNRRMS